MNAANGNDHNWKKILIKFPFLTAQLSSLLFNLIHIFQNCILNF